MKAVRRNIFFTFGLLFLSCTQTYWWGPIQPSKNCNPANITTITSTILWKQTLGGSKKRVRGCLRASWGSGLEENTGTLVELTSQGKMFGFDNTSQTFQSNVELNAQQNPDNKQHSFRLYTFGKTWQTKSQQEQAKHCTAFMAQPAYNCFQKSSDECWFYLDFYPASPPNSSLKVDKSKEGTCSIHTRPVLSEGSQEEPLQNEILADLKESAIENPVQENPEIPWETRSENPIHQERAISEHPEEKPAGVDGGESALPESVGKEQIPEQIPLCGYCVSTFAGPSYKSHIGPRLKVWLHDHSFGATDSRGNLYISDEVFHMIKKIDAKTGVVSVFAGTGINGVSNGPKKTSTFSRPKGMAFDGKGFMYIAGQGSSRIRKIDMATGITSTFLGDGGRPDRDGALKQARILAPTKVVFDAKGALYVLQTKAGTIRKVDIKQGTVSTFAGSYSSGYKNGPAKTAKFNEPQDIAVDKAGNVYVADTNNHCIRKIDTTGVVSTFVGTTLLGYKDASGTGARFNAPTSIVINSKGLLFVLDSGNRRVRSIDPTTRQVKTYAGSGSSHVVQGPIKKAAFGYYLRGLVIDPQDNLYVFGGALNGQHIQKIDTKSGVVSLYTGAPSRGYKDGPIQTALFNTPSSIAIDKNGDMYITDTQNNRIRKLDTKGQVTTVAGNGASFCVDNTFLKSSFTRPNYVAIGPNGNLFIADTVCNKIRKVDFNTLEVTTFAGTGKAGNKNGPKNQAEFKEPKGLLFDSKGNLYVADTGNHMIRLITSNGQVSTFAGTGKQGKANGKKEQATFNQPRSLIYDTTGNLIVVDSYNHKIRKIEPSGVVTDFAGSGSNGVKDGKAGVAAFSFPTMIAKNSKGDFFVSDYGSNRIRKIDMQGNVTTVAGSGQKGYRDGKGTKAIFHTPIGITIAPNDIMYVSEFYAQRIRRIIP